MINIIKYLNPKKYDEVFKKLMKGYESVKGKVAEGIDLLRIKQEAAEQVRQSEKVIKFPDEAITDWTKPRPTEGGLASVQNIKKKKGDPLAGYEDRIKPGSLLADMAARDPHGTRQYIDNSDFSMNMLHMVSNRKNQVDWNFLERYLGQRLRRDESVEELMDLKNKKFPDPEEFNQGGIAGNAGLNDILKL